MNIPSLLTGVFITLVVLILLFRKRIKNRIHKTTKNTDTDNVYKQKTTKKNRGVIAKLFGMNDARDYDELPMTDHATLKRWREGKPIQEKQSTIISPVIQTKTPRPQAPIKYSPPENIEIIEKNIDLVLKNNGHGA